MKDKYVFIRNATPAVMTRQLQRADKKHVSGEVPETIWRVANEMLANEARQLAFTSRRPYIECQREVLKQKPWLRLGVTGYMLDKHFPEVEFTQEDDSHADA